MLDKLLDKLYPLALRWYKVRPVRRVELEIRDRTISRLGHRIEALESRIDEEHQRKAREFEQVMNMLKKDAR